MTLERNLRISQKFFFFPRVGRLCSFNVQYSQWINSIFKKSSDMGHCSDCHKFTSVILIFSDSGILSLPVKLNQKKNDREVGKRRGKAGSAYPLAPRAHFLLFKEKEQVAHSLFVGPISCGLGHEYAPWAAETYIALKEATGIYSTQTKFNGLIFSG